MIKIKDLKKKILNGDIDVNENKDFYKLYCEPYYERLKDLIKEFNDINNDNRYFRLDSSWRYIFTVEKNKLISELKLFC